MRQVIHEEALAELRAAALQYADHSPAIALRFIEAVTDALARTVYSETRPRSCTP